MVSYGFRFDFLWFSLWFPMVSYGFRSGFLWFSPEVPMVFAWVPMVFALGSYGFHPVPLVFRQGSFGLLVSLLA